MNSFGQEIVRVRLELGYKTTKSFFNYLKSKGLDCNYQYFVKIEKNISFPSSILVNQIAKALDRSNAETIIAQFCKEQFSSYAYLFDSTSVMTREDQVKNLKKETHKIVSQGQKELNLLQIDTLHKRKENYFLFLILTLSRQPVKISDLEMLPQLKKSIKELKETAVINVENDYIMATSSEFVFPKMENSKLETIYNVFDEWDKEFSTHFKFKKHLNKMMIRRISPRYFSVMLKQIEAFTDFVRCSDESDQRYNNEVLHMHISISKGDLPG